MNYRDRSSAVSLYTSSALFERCYIHNNVTDEFHPIFVDEAQAEFRNCRITYNLAGASGSAIGVDKAAIKVDGSIIAHNIGEFGGGFDVIEGSIDLSRSTVTENSAYEGGGAEATFSGLLRIRQSILWGNCAAKGRDLYFDPGATVDIETSCWDSSQADRSPVVRFSADQIFRDPGFVRATGCDSGDPGDYHLTADSPCRRENNQLGLDIGADPDSCPPEAPSAARTAAAGGRTWRRRS